MNYQTHEVRDDGYSSENERDIKSCATFNASFWSQLFIWSNGCYLFFSLLIIKVLLIWYIPYIYIYIWKILMKSYNFWF